jgi:hypothetical protein
MNRALPPGDYGYRSSTPSRPSGSARALPGAGGLVGGVAAVATRIGHHCATFGPRSFLRRRLDVCGQGCRDLGGAGRNRGQKQKSPPRPEPGGHGYEL